MADFSFTEQAVPRGGEYLSAERQRRDEYAEEPREDKGTPKELEDAPLSREMVESFVEEAMRQPAWRVEADIAADYYDGNQTDSETIAALKARGQPNIQINLTASTVNSVLGVEAKSRTDWKVRPEDDDMATPDAADAMSVKLKHAEIESRADRACSDAYAAQTKTGVAWIEVGRERDPFRPSYRCKYVHRREIWWDWRSVEPDLDDAMWLLRRRWTDIEVAVAALPKYATMLRQSVNGWHGFDRGLITDDTNLMGAIVAERDTKLQDADWRDIERQRLCLYEIWYRKFVAGVVLRLPSGRVIECDLNNQRHVAAINSGAVIPQRATFRKIRCAMFAGPHFLYDVPSPFPFARFPYIPFFGYREDTTGVPYGLGRSLIPLQDEINARRRKLLWALNSRTVIVDEDAVADHKATAAEISRPDAYIVLAKNRKPGSTIKIDNNTDIAAQQFQVLLETKNEMSQASGVHKPMMGETGGATSGYAINSLVEQSVNALAELNDNYRYSRRIVGECLFDLVRQDMQGKPVTVMIGEGKRKKKIVLNEPKVDEQTGEKIIANDVSRMRTKVVIDDMPTTPTHRAATMAMLTEIVKSLPPELQGLMADFVVEATDHPKRHEIADRIRNATGVGSEDSEIPPDVKAAVDKLMAENAELKKALEQKVVEGRVKTDVATIAADARRDEAEIYAAGEIAKEAMSLDAAAAQGAEDRALAVVEMAAQPGASAASGGSAKPASSAPAAPAPMPAGPAPGMAGDAPGMTNPGNPATPGAAPAGAPPMGLTINVGGSKFGGFDILRDAAGNMIGIVPKESQSGDTPEAEALEAPAPEAAPGLK